MSTKVASKRHDVAWAAWQEGRSVWERSAIAAMNRPRRGPKECKKERVALRGRREMATTGDGHHKWHKRNTRSWTCACFV